MPAFVELAGRSLISRVPLAQSSPKFPNQRGIFNPKTHVIVTGAIQQGGSTILCVEREYADVIVMLMRIGARIDGNALEVQLRWAEARELECVAARAAAVANEQRDATAIADAVAAARVAAAARERYEGVVAANRAHHGVRVRRAKATSWHLCERHSAPVSLVKVLSAVACSGSELIVVEFNQKIEIEKFGLATWANDQIFAPLASKLWRPGERPGGIQRCALATNVRQDAGRGLRMFAPLVPIDGEGEAHAAASLGEVASRRRRATASFLQAAVDHGRFPLSLDPRAPSMIEFFESPGRGELPDSTRGCGFAARIARGDTPAGRAARAAYPLPNMWRVVDGVREQLEEWEVMRAMVCNLSNSGVDLDDGVLYQAVDAERGGVRCDCRPGAPERPPDADYYGGRHGALANKDAIALAVHSVTHIQAYCTVHHQIKESTRTRSLKTMADLCSLLPGGGVRFTSSEDIADELLDFDHETGIGFFELGVHRGEVCMRFEVRFNEVASRMPDFCKLALPVIVEYIESILPIKSVYVSANADVLLTEFKCKRLLFAADMQQLFAEGHVDEHTRLKDLEPHLQVELEGRWAELLRLVFVHDEQLSAAIKAYELLKRVRAALEAAAAAAARARDEQLARREAAARRRADASAAAAADAAAAQSYPWVGRGNGGEQQEPVLGDGGAESDADGGDSESDGGDSATGDGGGFSVMEAHIRAYVDREMAFELLRLLTGSRGKSCKLDKLHQKVIDAWAERLSVIGDAEHSQMLHDHVPGAELDRRYAAAMEKAAYESAMSGMSQRLRELVGW